MTRAVCDECAESFQTKKLLIKHIKSNECTKAKKQSSRNGPVSKRPRMEIQGTTSAAAGSSSSQISSSYSQKQMEILQNQITQLSQKQKEVLQAQITQKQRQVLQAIPYNQLSEKQKDILKRLSSNKPASPVPVAKTVTSVHRPTTASVVKPTAPLVTPKPPGQVGSAISAQKPVQLKANVTGPISQVQNIKNGRRKNVYTRIPAEKQINTPRSTTPKSQAQSSSLSVDSSEPVITEFVFCENSIAAENIEIIGEAVSQEAPPDLLSGDSLSAEENSKSGHLKVKSFGKAFQEISNVISPSATPKETCTFCKKIFSKQACNNM